MALKVTLPDRIPVSEGLLTEACDVALDYLGIVACLWPSSSVDESTVLADLCEVIVELSWVKDWPVSTTVDAVMGWAEQTAGDL